MKVRVKKIGDKGILRVEGSGEIKEVFVNEDILKPENEVFSVCFMGENLSGIIGFSREELDKLKNTIDKKANFIQEMKLLVGERPSDKYLKPKKTLALDKIDNKLKNKSKKR